MTMGFRTIKDAIATLLSDNAVAGGYRVVGYDDDAVDAEYLKDTNRLVQVYAQSGEFPRSGGAMVGSVTHDLTINIDLTTAKAASADLTVLDNPNSSAAEFAAALAAQQNASDLADADIDEFVDYVYQLLMSPVNQDMGLDIGFITNRWIPRWSKGKPMPRGGNVIMTATLDIEMRTSEDLIGETPTVATEGAHLGIEIGEDLEDANAGVVSIPD